MSVSTLLTAGSLLLGLAAWALPLARPGWVLRRGGRGESLSLLSGLACALSLTLQLLEIRHRVALQDWSALLDTLGPLTQAAVTLVAVTFLLNLAALAAVRPAGPPDAGA